VHAGLRSRRVENELRLPVLLQHGVRMAHYDRAIGIPVGSSPQAEQTEVDHVREGRRRQNEEKTPEEDSP